MAYVKPGVTVKQVQTTVSPNLAPPSLVPCVIGTGYSLVETKNDDIDVYTAADFATVRTYDNDAGCDAFLNTRSNSALDTSSVYVDILTIGGLWGHVPSTSYTVDGAADSVTIDAISFAIRAART